MSIKSVAKSPFLFGGSSEARNKMAEQQTISVTGVKVTTGLESLLGSIKEGSYSRSKPTSAGGGLIPPGTQSRILKPLNEGIGSLNFPDIDVVGAYPKYLQFYNEVSQGYYDSIYLEVHFGKVERHRRKALKRFNKAAKQAVKQFLNK